MPKIYLKVIGDSCSHNYEIGRVLTFERKSLYGGQIEYRVEEGTNFLRRRDFEIENESELEENDCDECGRIVKVLDMYPVSDDTQVCKNCFEDGYAICDNCGVVALDDYYDFGICNNCQADRERREDEGDHDERERRYSSDNTYANESGRVYAVEIECNFKDWDDRANLFDCLPSAVGITPDGSLGDYGVELQTPKLNGEKGDKLLKQILNHLNENDFSVDTKCGLHVHIDTADFFKAKVENGDVYLPSGTTPAQKRLAYKRVRDIKIRHGLQMLLLTYLAFEPVIYSFLPNSRRTNRYCFPLSEFYHAKEIENLNTLDDFEKMWYREQTKNAIKNRKKEKYDSTRYAGYNFHSMLANKHIEARHHSGTLDYNKIKNWIILNIAILDKVKAGAITGTQLAEIKSTTDLKQKTALMFDLLGIDEKIRKYFEARQEKFSIKNNEEKN